MGSNVDIKLIEKSDKEVGLGEWIYGAECGISESASYLLEGEDCGGRDMGCGRIPGGGLCREETRQVVRGSVSKEIYNIQDTAEDGRWRERPLL